MVKTSCLRGIGALVCSLFVLFLFSCSEKSDVSADQMEENDGQDNKCLAYDYKLINFQDDTIQKSGKEKFNIQIREGNSGYYLCSVIDNEYTFDVLGETKSNDSLKYISKESDTILIVFGKGQKSYFQNTKPSNLLLPSYSIYQGFFEVNIGNDVKHKVHRFENYTIYEDGYESRSVSFVMEPYIPLLIYFPQKMFQMEISDKGYFNEIINAIKQSNFYTEMLNIRTIEPPAP